LDLERENKKKGKEGEKKKERIKEEKKARLQA